MIEWDNVLHRRVYLGTDSQAVTITWLRLDKNIGSVYISPNSPQSLSQHNM